MKILLITSEPPLNPDEVVSGNAVRANQLCTAMAGAGHEVVQTWLSSKRIRPAGSFRNRDELKGLLVSEQPQVIIAGYWELLGMLPSKPDVPVVLDYVAPRSLEELYESPETVRDNMKRFRLNLERCDAVLVGNEIQGTLLLNTLIEAGLDLRQSLPVLTVPLGAPAVGAPGSSPGDGKWSFVTGGVNWPWRQSGTFASELDRLCESNQHDLTLTQFGGSYKWHPGDEARPTIESPSGPNIVRHQELQSYAEFSRFLSEHAHIGIELSEINLERKFSQSFRSLEFLRHGLPIICNDYLPIARLVRKHKAGWVVSGAEELPSLVQSILDNPEDWRQRSANALKLTDEMLAPEKSTAALIHWLEDPVKATRLPNRIRPPEETPVLGVPPLRQRVARQFKLVRQVLLKRVFGQDQGPGVVIVTRSDLFPVDHGAAVRTVETARALARQGLEVGIVTDNQKHWYRIIDGEAVKMAYPAWVRLMSIPAPLTKLLHFSKDIPYSNSFLYLPLTDKGFKWRTIAAARVLHAGVLQAEFPAYALPCIEVAETLDCKTVMVQHNVEYDRIRAQVEELEQAQYENLKEIEISLCNRCDAVVCVSDNDRQRLGEDGVDNRRMHTILHGVNLEAFDEPPEPDVRNRLGMGKNEILLIYHGTFSYPPNREALQIFAEIILPRLEKKGLVCHVMAVGRNPPATSPHPRIHIIGSVDEVAPWLKAADMSVIPLVEGGGTRMKIIDCFAASLPVISTSKGIEGIPVVDGREALVIDDWDAMVDAIVDLRTNPEKADRLATAGRKLADSLDWNAIARQYIALYGAL